MSEEERQRLMLDEEQGRMDQFEVDDSRSMPPPRPSSSDWRSTLDKPIFPVLSYCAASILMTVANKYIVSFPDYNLTFFLLAVQAIVCVAAIEICKSAKLISYRDFKVSEAKKWYPVSLLLIAMIYTGIKALKYLSIPVYTIFKNLTIIVIAYGEVLWFGASITPMTLFSFGLMVFSSLIAAWADIKHALDANDSNSGKAHDQLATLHTGYMWMFGNCLAQASYILLMRKRIKVTNFSDFDSMFYNNLLTIPVLLATSLIAEDWSAVNVAKNFPAVSRSAIISAMIFTGVASIFISYCTAWCIRVTSSTTYSMVGALNKLPLAISGLVFFDAPITIPSVSAIFVGFASGVVYAIAKAQQKAKQGLQGILPTTAPISSSSQSNRDSLR
ncbi:Golgi GDP-mannose transporter [Microthyrium microscopicum]|uniref:GDP-mannose transporter n=1 Tax=Microthyrium microscopicum TaxID=703497 RepID=A0A6A6UMQ7_9PEZI|nr:Golgi GDP-mannose transporter [Microthyrium microscopicum]